MPEAKYRGILAKPIPGSVIQRGILETDEEHELRFTTAYMARWTALFEHYAIDQSAPDANTRLMFALAKDWVPGFQFQRGNPRHRPVRWPPGRRLELWADVLVRQRKGEPLRDAIGMLAGRGRWRDVDAKKMKSILRDKQGIGPLWKVISKARSAGMPIDDVIIDIYGPQKKSSNSRR